MDASAAKFIGAGLAAIGIGFAPLVVPLPALPPTSVACRSKSACH